jgi:hypothetical protein
MHLGEIVTDLKDHFEKSKANAETFLTEHLPALAGLAEHAASNPLIESVLKAVHLSPDMLTLLAQLVDKADADIASLQPATPVTEPETGDPAADLPQAV